MTARSDDAAGASATVTDVHVAAEVIEYFDEKTNVMAVTRSDDIVSAVAVGAGETRASQRRSKTQQQRIDQCIGVHAGDNYDMASKEGALLKKMKVASKDRRAKKAARLSEPEPRLSKRGRTSQ